MIRWRVQADYETSYGIYCWRDRGFEGEGWVQQVPTRLPPQLLQQFKFWISLVAAKRFNLNTAIFNEQGLHLAAQLQAHVGKEATVAYEPWEN